MSYKVGIIPAAGKSMRFGRIPKEMLPLPDGKALIDHAVSRLSFCERIVVVTNPDKYPLHRAIVGQNINMVYQTGNEMFGAWMTACGLYKADRYYMTMPDTYIDDNAFDACPHDKDFALGVFETNNPERFGVLAEGGVKDKYEDAPVPATAWGALMWSYDVYKLWCEKRLWDYTAAINEALGYAGLHTWQIGKYFDCADAYHFGELWDELRGRHA